MKFIQSIVFIFFSLCCLPAASITIAKGVSMYQQQINDSEDHDVLFVTSRGALFRVNINNFKSK